MLIISENSAKNIAYAGLLDVIEKVYLCLIHFIARILPKISLPWRIGGHLPSRSSLLDYGRNSRQVWLVTYSDGLTNRLNWPWSLISWHDYGITRSHLYYT